MALGRSGGVWALLVLAAGWGVGCTFTTAFHCHASAQCVLRGMQGRCEPKGYCSFPDPGCPGGSRYGQWADPSLANVCVGGDLGVELGPDGGGPDLVRPKNPGDSCGGDGECASGHCSDGVCCDSACNDACHACNLTGLAGTCSPVASGAGPAAGHPACGPDPMSSCARDGTCDGQGACRDWPLGTPCGAGTCASGVAKPPPTCDGKGSCVPSTQSLTCAPYACGATACKTSCTGSGDCDGGNTCTGGSCGPKPNGASCSTDSECASAHCAQGYCCDGACTATCMSCALPNKLGTCSAVPSGGADPQGGCKKGAGLDATCAPGGCDGAGSCLYANSGTACQTAMCSTSTNTETFAGACNATGTCQVPSPPSQSCTPYLCGPTACTTSCTVNTDCASGDVCVAGACTTPRAVSCPFAGAILCDSFEGSLSPSWAVDTNMGADGSFTIDPTRSLGGTSSLKVHVNAVSGSKYVQLRLIHDMLDANPLYIRMWIYVPSTVPASDMQLINVRQDADPYASGLLNLTQTRQLEIGTVYLTSNVDATSSGAMPLDQWVCLEWQVETRGSGTSDPTFMNVLENDGQVATGSPVEVSPATNLFQELYLGDSASLYNTPAFDFWIDEVVVAKSPIGCSK